MTVTWCYLVTSHIPKYQETLHIFSRLLFNQFTCRQKWPRTKPLEQLSSDIPWTCINCETQVFASLVRLKKGHGAMEQTAFLGFTPARIHGKLEPRTEQLHLLLNHQGTCRECRDFCKDVGLIQIDDDILWDNFGSYGTNWDRLCHAHPIGMTLG